MTEHEDTSEELCIEHGYDQCPDCGNSGVKITANGYENCTRFLTCWADFDIQSSEPPENSRASVLA